MNRRDLYKATKEIVSQKLEDVTIKDTGVFVDAVFKAIQNGLVAGEKIALTGFGTFETVERAGRECKNPRTGEPVYVEASKAVKFKAGKLLKESVNA